MQPWKEEQLTIEMGGSVRVRAKVCVIAPTKSEFVKVAPVVAEKEAVVRH